MLFQTATLLALATLVLGHGDHDHQAPISGPHKSLWYNTIPGDGGTQVRRLPQLPGLMINQRTGGLRLLRYLDLWPIALLSMPSE